VVKPAVVGAAQAMSMRKGALPERQRLISLKWAIHRLDWYKPSLDFKLSWLMITGKRDRRWHSSALGSGHGLGRSEELRVIGGDEILFKEGACGLTQDP